MLIPVKLHVLRSRVPCLRLNPLLTFSHYNMSKARERMTSLTLVLTTIALTMRQFHEVMASKSIVASGYDDNVTIHIFYSLLCNLTFGPLFCVS